MDNKIRFETPENVEVEYELAGLGSRFVAWIEDQLIVFLSLFLTVFALIFLGSWVDWVNKIPGIGGLTPANASYYFAGTFMVIYGFGNLVYFALCELFMGGRTLGKKHAGVRVIKVNGYALDLGSILIRNVLRVIDHIPLFWLVPAFSSRSQRFGDMLAGTLCVRDDPQKLGGLRDTLAARLPTERRFRFDINALQRVRQSDFHAVERILESKTILPDVKFDELLEKLCEPLATRMNVNPPEADSRQQFLEDLLSAEYQRQLRKLG